MMNLSTDLIVSALGSKRCVGGVALPNDRLGFVFDDGTVVMIEGKALLMTQQESTEALAYVERATVRQGAALQTLTTLKTGTDPGARLSARREATVQERDRTAARQPVKTIIDAAIEGWSQAEYPTVGSGISDIERRARTERIAREVPEIR